MIASVLAKQYHFTAYVIGANLQGMSEEQALTCPPGGGSCANWVLGHILSARNGVHHLLGLEAAFPPAKAARYARGTAPVTPADPGEPLADLLAAFQASQQKVAAALPGLSPQQLAREMAMPDPLKEGPVGAHLGLLLFHESYHAGQLGVLRRLAGIPGAVA